MKKLLLSLTFFTAITANAQLNKGNKLVGLQMNLTDGGIYASYPALSFGSTHDRYGFNLIPTYGVAVERNWVIGGQATIGYLRNTTEYGAQVNRNTNFDIGIGPFTRLYLDITRNGKFKAFGMASVELSNHTHKYRFTDHDVTIIESNANNTQLNGTIGLGLAYFGKKISIDLNVSEHGLRIGFYLPHATGTKK